MGFQKIYNTSFPITLIPRNIDEFVPQKHKILFVLQKEYREQKYKDVLMELKKGLFTEIYKELPDELKQMCESCQDENL